MGLSFDAWLFHPQIGELTDLARAFPDTRIVLDHCGGPVGIGSYAHRREEIFPVWKASIAAIANCPNVSVKLGGLAMRLLGFDFHERTQPPSSEQAAAAWRPYMETCIEAFGPGRCMFESNFPPDKGQWQLPGDLQRLQAHRRALQRGREDRVVLEDGGGFLPARARLSCVAQPRPRRLQLAERRDVNFHQLSWPDRPRSTSWFSRLANAAGSSGTSPSRICACSSSRKDRSEAAFLWPAMAATSG